MKVLGALDKPKAITNHSNNTWTIKTTFCDVEFQARREKGLCFCCEEKFCGGHRCKVKDQKELRVLVVQANGEELEVVEEDDRTEELEVKAIELDIEQKEPVIELSLTSWNTGLNAISSAA